MVLDEIKYDEATPKNPDGANSASRKNSESLGSFENRLAAPVDRLAAVLADLVVFLPIMAVIIAPLRKKALLAQLLGHESDWISALVSTSVLGVLAFILFQTACVAIWGATPGKRAFGLRVVSVWDGARPRPIYAFMRSIGWVLELVFLGAPWLAVFGNEKRRPFHDRFADTAVIVVGERKPAGPPGLAEMSISSGVNAAVVAGFTLFGLVTLAKLQHDIRSGASLAQEMESKGMLCQAAGEAKDEWMTIGGGKTPSRLAVALALFGADAVDEACLEMEADFSIWRNEEKTLAYLGKAFVHAENANLYESYLDKVCELEPKSAACNLARLIRHDANLGQDVDDPEEKAEQVAEEHSIEMMVSKLGPSTPIYLKVWVIRHLMDEGRYADALERIDEISPHRHLGYFFARERAQALWRLDRRDDARLAMRASIETFDPDQRVELSRWFCFTETSEEGCTEKSRFACGLFGAAVDRSDKWLGNPDVAATYIRGESCREDMNAERLAKLESKIPSKEAKTYLKALAHLKKEEREKGIKFLMELATSADQQGPFFVEANARLAELATSAADLARIKKLWLAMEPGEGWRYLGRQLASRFNSLRAWDQSLEVGLKMMEADRFDRQLYRALVVAAFRSGNERMALGFLENLQRADETKIQMDRTPASFDDFNQVAQELLARGEAQRKAAP